MPWVDYIKSLEDLNKQPAFIILYSSGASGEFLAVALTDSITTIAQPEVSTCDSGRTIYREFFAHELKKGTWGINETELIYRANIARNLFKGEHYIILAHPRGDSLEFLKKYLTNIPLIEITMNNPVSYKFSARAAVAKIQSGTPLEYYNLRPPVSGYQHPKHLQVEWSDLILAHPGKTFDRIQNFIGLTGDRSIFEQRVTEYCERNQDLIKAANEV
jgi:hypothetical protein